MRQLRWAIPVVVLMFIGIGVVYFLVTVRLVGREVQSALATPEPMAFDGPDLVNGYVLMRGLRGPESFIEDAAGRMVVPAPGSDLSGLGVTRLALIGGRFIVGEVADMRDGKVVEWFLIDAANATVTRAASRGEWEAGVRGATGEDAPDLELADLFEAPQSTQPDR